MYMRYAVIPEEPEDEDLTAFSSVICAAMGLPEDDAHPSSMELVAVVVVDAYRALFNTYGVPTPTPE